MSGKYKKGDNSSPVNTGDFVPSEQTPLLPGEIFSHSVIRHDKPNGGKQWVLETWSLFQDAVPVILGYMLQMSLQAITVVIAGRRSPFDLSVAAFSLMFALVTGWMIALGGTTALDTLASSTFTASQNKTDLGILLQRALFVLTLFYIPVATLWACSEQVFLKLGQDAELSLHCSRFLTCLIPGGLGYIFFETMKKYMQAQGIMRASTYVLLITSPLNAFLCYLFCYKLNIGILGAAISNNITYWLSFTLLVLYAKFIEGAECWGGWSRDALKSLRVFARLAILGVLHVGTEWWAFEIVALAAGRMGPIPLAAQSTIMTADQILNTIPFGIGIAISSRVGKSLGGRNAVQAKRTAHLGTIMACIIGGIVLITLMLTRDSFGRIFNDDDRVIQLTSDVLPFVALFQVSDAMNGCCGGVLRGMGRQHLGAAVNIVSYYFFALPLGISLAFWYGWGLNGLWIGQCVALWAAGVLQWIIVFFTKWDEEVDKALKRIEQDQPEDRFHDLCP